MAIPLGHFLRNASSDIPEGHLGNKVYVLLIDLASGGVYLARPVTSPAVRFYRTVSPVSVFKKFIIKPDAAS